MGDSPDFGGWTIKRRGLSTLYRFLWHRQTPIYQIQVKAHAKCAGIIL